MSTSVARTLAAAVALCVALIVSPALWAATHPATDVPPPPSPPSPPPSRSSAPLRRLTDLVLLLDLPPEEPFLVQDRLTGEWHAVAPTWVVAGGGEEQGIDASNDASVTWQSTLPPPPPQRGDNGDDGNSGGDTSTSTSVGGDAVGEAHTRPPPTFDVLEGGPSMLHRLSYRGDADSVTTFLTRMEDASQSPRSSGGSRSSGHGGGDSGGRRTGRKGRKARRAAEARRRAAVNGVFNQRSSVHFALDGRHGSLMASPGGKGGKGGKGGNGGKRGNDGKRGNGGTSGTGGKGESRRSDEREDSPDRLQGSHEDVLVALLKAGADLRVWCPLVDATHFRNLFALDLFIREGMVGGKGRHAGGHGKAGKMGKMGKAKQTEKGKNPTPTTTKSAATSAANKAAKSAAKSRKARVDALLDLQVGASPVSTFSVARSYDILHTKT